MCKIFLKWAMKVQQLQALAMRLLLCKAQVGLLRPSELSLMLASGWDVNESAQPLAIA
jgi:hypothetical protein